MTREMRAALERMARADDRSVASMVMHLVAEAARNSEPQRQHPGDDAHACVPALRSNGDEKMATAALAKRAPNEAVASPSEIAVALALGVVADLELRLGSEKNGLGALVSSAATSRRK